MKTNSRAVDPLSRKSKCEMLDVLVWGYFSIMQRLSIRQHPVAPFEGSTGKLTDPVLMADAPLIALTLSKAGHRVGAALSHPGQSPNALAAAEFINSRVAECQFGANCGTPFHIQLVSDTGEARWFSDATFGLESLKTVTTPESDIPRWFYVDAYPWLHEIIDSTLKPRFRDGLFVNLGTSDKRGLQETIARWRHLAGGRLLAVQASAGSENISQTAVRVLAEMIVGRGADLAIVTAGGKGLAVTSCGSTSYATPEYVECSTIRTDTTGAGAAVSASVIQTLLGGCIMPELLATQAAEAGRIQCTVSGPLGFALRDDWAATVRKSSADCSDSRRETHPPQIL